MGGARLPAAGARAALSPCVLRSPPSSGLPHGGRSRRAWGAGATRETRCLSELTSAGQEADIRSRGFPGCEARAWDASGPGSSPTSEGRGHCPPKKNKKDAKLVSQVKIMSGAGL